MRLVPITIALMAEATAGCMLFTGSTDGYALVDAGQGEASVCSEAGCLALGCASAAECGAGQVCCLVTSLSSSIAATCQAAPCGGLLPVQLCSTGGECDGGMCTMQRCGQFALRACGLTAGCTAQ